MMESDFTQDEMAKVFEGVEVSDERLALVDKSDQYIKR